jgi:hypothetical protein
MIASLAVSAFACLLPVQEQGKLELPKQPPPMFAVAKASQDGKSIAVTKSQPSGVQTYTVQVPVTRIVKDKDGNNRAVVEMRTETRQRNVSRARMVQETYTTMVPVKKLVKDKDGNEKEVTVNVPQTRTRMRRIGGTPPGKPKLHPLAKCQFSDVAGKSVTPEEAAKRLKKKAPIILLRKDQKLESFYRVALNPQILLVTLPVPKPGKPPAGANEEWKPLEGGDGFGKAADGK